MYFMLREFRDHCHSQLSLSSLTVDADEEHGTSSRVISFSFFIDTPNALRTRLRPEAQITSERPSMAVSQGLFRAAWDAMCGWFVWHTPRVASRSALILYFLRLHLFSLKDTRTKGWWRMWGRVQSLTAFQVSETYRALFWWLYFLRTTSQHGGRQDFNISLFGTDAHVLQCCQEQSRFWSLAGA